MFKDNPDFYPTPKSLIYKMLSGIDFKQIQSVLEPSAGKGDLVDAVTEKFKYNRGYYNAKNHFDID
ncbi:MAG TPA: DNA methyltransferase, partial [Clostridia bacterium]|nr:DNA methyltransferase [Clostridia bacterium]